MEDIKEIISALESYRLEWGDDIREGRDRMKPGSKEVLYKLYEISGVIIQALENSLTGSKIDKMAMHMAYDKLEKLVESEHFKVFTVRGDACVRGVVPSGMRSQIRIMKECLDFLMA